jgi:hypothetical protein
MQKQEKQPVTVVSEGLVFKGVRTRFAFVWVEVAAVPPKPAKASTALSSYVLDFLREAHLSKEDRARCRRQVADMSTKDIQRLVSQLRGFRRSSARQ